MNLDDLTLGQAKDLANLFNGNNLTPKVSSSNILKDAIGKYVIVRTRNRNPLTIK